MAIDFRFFFLFNVLFDALIFSQQSLCLLKEEVYASVMQSTDGHTGAVALLIEQGRSQLLNIISIYLMKNFVTTIQTAFTCK